MQTAEYCTAAVLPPRAARNLSQIHAAYRFSVQSVHQGPVYFGPRGQSHSPRGFRATQPTPSDAVPG